MSHDAEATFFTISDERFFPGTVALLNSLRLTGHVGPLVVLDVGLRHAQRVRLEEHARVVQRPNGLSRPQFKAFPLLLNPEGVIVIIDSDMIVTRPLDHLIDLAAEGKICVFPDHFSQSGRRFEEWQTILRLKSPLRRQTYVNGGFIGLSTNHWPDFLSRLWELTERVPVDGLPYEEDRNARPFTGGDQDPLNALLMSEIPPEGIEMMPYDHEVHPDRLADTRIIDAKTLGCVIHGERPALLHYSMGPKAWDRTGWIRVRRDAYVQLFGRVVCGGDVPLRMEPRELPLWLRPSSGGRFALAALDVAHGLVAAIRRVLPPRASAAVRRATRRYSGSRGP